MSNETFIRFCAPTMARLKTGNMFNCTFANREEMAGELRRLNQRLREKGLRILPLRWNEGKALLYLYRPKMLEEDLSNALSRQLLAECGYSSGNASCCLLQLMERLRENEEFPHEIGLFLGYPPEDVRGFIENRARCSKCTGCWKVYGDREKAQQMFSRYKKCSRIYRDQWEKGKSIERLTVTV